MSRILRIGASCALALVVVTCTEPTFTGPDGTGMAALNFSAFAPHAGGLPVPVESLEVRLQRPADESFAFDSVFPTSNATKGDSAVITFHVVLRQSAEDFLLSIRAFGGGITWYTASSPIRISAGAKATPMAFVVQYVGPGANAARIVIAPSDTTVVGGMPFPLRTDVFNSGQALIPGVPVGYHVSDTSLAFVTQLTPLSATFTGKPGVRDSVWVVAETPTHLKDSTRVHIIPTIPVSTVTILPKVDTIANGATWLYTAVAKDLSGVILSTPFAWTSTDPAVASVSSTGLATALSGGSTMIIVSAGGVADTAWLYVRALQSITLSPDDIVIPALGEVVYLQAAVVYNFGTVVGDFASLRAPVAGKTRVIVIGGSNIRYASASPSVATVDSMTGEVRIIGPGDAVIVAHASVASSDSLIRGFATLHVNQVTAAIYNSPKSPVTIGIGGRAQLTATAVDANGYSIAGKAFSWTAKPDSTTGGQVSVTSTGLVTGVAVGTTYVYASLVEVPSAFQDSTVVVVSDNPPQELRWAFDSMTVGKGGTVWVGLSVTIPTPGPGPRTIEIESSDPRFAQARSSTVTIPAGMSTTSVEIEGIAIGRAIFTAKDGGGSGHYDDGEMIVNVVSTDLPSLMFDKDISVAVLKTVPTYVAIPFPAPADITVTLRLSGINLGIQVPATVTIRKGSSSANFNITTGLLGGLCFLTASAPGFSDAVALSINVLGL